MAFSNNNIVNIIAKPIQHQQSLYKPPIQQYDLRSSNIIVVPRSAVGCEPSGTLGEDPRQKPTNLFPVVTQVLKSERPALDVFGSDWETCDGTAVRDYIHVVDLARGHIAALAAAEERPAEMAFRAYNLGTGRGSTVNQVVESMDKAAGRPIPVRMAGRREGDVGVCVADTGRAERELGWRTGMSLDECARDTWRCIRGAVVVGV